MRRIRLVVAAVVVIAGLGAPASGQDLTISPVSVADFGSVQLDGTAQNLTASISDFTVADTRLVSTGWKVTTSATQFAEWDPTADGGAGAYVPGGHTFPNGSLRMLEPTVTGGDGTPDTTAVVTPGPYYIDGAAVLIATGPLLATGTYTFTQGGPLRLTVPARAYAGTYRSDVTISLDAGP